MQASPADMAQVQRAISKRIHKLNRQPDGQDLFGVELPEELQGEYPFEWSDAGMPKDIQRKYQKRSWNIRRSWNRLELYAPELLKHRETPYSVFEMSTAHGGMLEVCRHFGHSILGNDYLNLTAGQARGEGAYHRAVNDELNDRELDDYRLPIPKPGEAVSDWCYRPIIEAQKIPMALFDGGMVPYPLEDKSQDYLFCMQAIEHYCHPDDWDNIVKEFCRISRRAVIIYLNRIPHHLSKNEDYIAAFDRARTRLRNWNQNGFECTNVQMRFQQALGFKLTAV
ncbi:hypothetical protein [Shimia ponticola]|uniref:hypothetical protein n=1 Tax=Shimia ponticola TaxID=2582893 RepID=UPI001C9AB99D|nr:hypothetical protein [Shimia ponticola]